MSFWLYLVLSSGALLLLLSFVLYFGRAYLSGAPYAVSTTGKIDEMMALLQKEGATGKRAVDLGSGDGRVVIALAKAGYEAHGYESNPYLVWLSKRKIKKAGLQGKACIHKKDYWKENFKDYDVVVVFGVFYIMQKLKKKLQEELTPGSTVVSNYFAFDNWQPKEQTETVFLYKR